MKILETKQLKKYYGSGDTLVKALDGIDLSVEQGEFVSIVGTSGSGKSTLLHMLGGLDRPTSGMVKVEGRDISRLKDEELTIFRRRKIGFVFQSYNLVPVLNVYENIVLPVELDGNKVDTAYVRDIIEVLGLEKKNTIFRVSSPAVNSRGWRLQERSHRSLQFFWLMSLPVIWTLQPVRMC